MQVFYNIHNNKQLQKDTFVLEISLKYHFKIKQTLILHMKARNNREDFKILDLGTGEFFVAGTLFQNAADASLQTKKCRRGRAVGAAAIGGTGSSCEVCDEDHHSDVLFPGRGQISRGTIG